jgi:hypothetical protein
MLPSVLLSNTHVTLGAGTSREVDTKVLQSSSHILLSFVGSGLRYADVHDCFVKAIWCTRLFFLN